MDAGLSLQATDFELFGLPERFDVDLAALDAKWKQLQGAAHPDRFATETAAAQRVAMQWAVRINEAYRRLKNPLARAAYLCSLHGVDLEAESNTAMPPAFLMQQMEWRERIEDASAAKNVDALDALLAELRDEEKVRFTKLAALLASGSNQAAGEAVRQLMFIERVASEIGTQIERLDN